MPRNRHSANPRKPVSLVTLCYFVYAPSRKCTTSLVYVSASPVRGNQQYILKPPRLGSCIRIWQCSNMACSPVLPPGISLPMLFLVLTVPFVHSFTFDSRVFDARYGRHCQMKKSPHIYIHDELRKKKKKKKESPAPAYLRSSFPLC